MIDVEALLVGWLAEQFPDVRVLTETPAKMPAQVLRVYRIGGPNRWTIDEASMDVDAYVIGRDAARKLALAAQQAMLFDLRGRQYEGASVKDVKTVSGVAWRPYDNTDLRRFGFTVNVTVKPV